MEHVVTFNENLNQIHRLRHIHEEITGSGPGYRSNVEVLNKSGVVLLVACWEAYVEDLAESSFDFLISKATDHRIFPNRVLTHASKTFWDAKDPRTVWSLAGSGWKKVLQAHRVQILQAYVGALNTPRANQVDQLFECLVGIRNLSSQWSWKGVTSSQARKKLGDLITLRGSIAHRVTTSKSVKKADVYRNSVFLIRLAAISSNALRVYLHGRTGAYPWDQVEFGFSTTLPQFDSN